MEKMKKTFVLLDVIEMILLVISYVLLFILFLLDNSFLSYIFLLADLFIIVRFAFALFEFDKDREEYVKKYKNNRVNARYLKKVNL